MILVHIDRLLMPHIKEALREKIILLSGPRQCGKTTLAQMLEPDHDYVNYDSVKHRLILQELSWDRQRKLLILDELHKMKKWKTWLKGVFDTEGISPQLLVTGSAHMDVYRKGGDSLAGRYFSCRLHPFTVKEASLFMDSKDAFKRLIAVGGFPEPFLKNDIVFAKRWRRSHIDIVLSLVFTVVLILK